MNIALGTEKSGGKFENTTTTILDNNALTTYMLQLRTCKVPVNLAQPHPPKLGDPSKSPQSN